MKRISFALTLVFSAALSSLFVASAQDPDEQPAPPPAEAPADPEAGDEAAPEETTPPADEAPLEAAPPADEAPMDEATPPADEAPLDEAAPPADDPMDEAVPPADETPMEEAPAGEAPVDEAPAGEPLAPAGEDVAPEAAPAPAPAPAAAAPKTVSSLKVASGEAELERRAAAMAEPLRAKLTAGQAAGLTTDDTALFGAEAGGVARFGGCEVTLSEHTTFKVLSVGQETSTVEILGIELELTRGTILDAAFGSLQLEIKQGTTRATNNTGQPQVIQINFGGVRYTLKVPAAAPGQPAPSISMSSNGTFSVQGADASGGIEMTSQQLDESGEPVGDPQPAGTLSDGDAGGLNEIVDEGGTTLTDAITAGLVDSGSNSSDDPPAGTLPGADPENISDGSQ